MDIIICYIIIYTVEAIILWHYSENIFNSKSSKLIAWSSLLFLYAALFFIHSLESIAINISAFLIVNFIFIIINYQASWIAALFHATLTTSAMSISEAVIAGSLSKLLYNIDHENAYLLQFVILALLSKILYFSFMHVILNVSKHAKEKVTTTNVTTYPLTIIPIITTWISAILLYFCITTDTTSFMTRMVSISALLMFVINFLVYGIYRYNQRKEAEYAELQLQLQKESDASEYYRMLLQENENRSILIHDIKKHLHSISSLNEQGETEKITFYINTLLNSTSLKSSVRVCDHDLLNAILCRYQRSCDEKAVSFRIDIRSKSVHFIKDNDVTSLFCNLLDNALAAAVIMPEGYIDLMVSRRQNTNFTVITLINSCRYNPFDEYGRLITRKPNRERHGFGMKSIQRIVNKYNGEMTYYFDDESKTFHTILLLRNEEITL